MKLLFILAIATLSVKAAEQLKVAEDLYLIQVKDSTNHKTCIDNGFTDLLSDDLNEFIQNYINEENIEELVTWKTGSTGICFNSFRAHRNVLKVICSIDEKHYVVCLSLSSYYRNIGLIVVGLLAIPVVAIVYFCNKLEKQSVAIPQPNIYGSINSN